MWCISKGYLLITTQTRHRSITATKDLYIASSDTSRVFSLSPIASTRYMNEFHSPTVSSRTDGHAIIHMVGDSNCYLTTLRDSEFWLLCDEDTRACGDETMSHRVLTESLMSEAETIYELAVNLRTVKLEPLSSWKYYKLSDLTSTMVDDLRPSSIQINDLPGAPKPRYRVKGSDVTLIK